MTHVEPAPLPGVLDRTPEHRAPHRPALVGREPEIAEIRAFVGELEERGSVLLLTGDPGVGKTALTDAAVEYARWRGLAVLRAAGVEAEQDVPWATLHQLLHVLRDRIPGLPAPQREALGAAFGEIDSAPSSVFMAGVGALTMLSERATAAGLLIVVEDVHWVDPATRGVLSFLGRRLAEEPIGLLLTSRASDVDVEFTASPDARILAVNPLTAEHSRELLADRRQSLPPRVLERVLDESLGNPLALIELSAARHRLQDSSVTPMPLTRKLERAFAQRLEGLSDDELAVILIAAVSADPRQTAVLEGAARLRGEPIDERTVQSLILLDLLHRSRSDLTFRHPLVRSAVIQSVSASRRAQAHRAVASMLPAGTDRRLWHLAVVAETPDRSLSDALDNAANRAIGTGDPATAYGAYRRAAELSPDIADRVRRTYRAAAAALSIQLVLEAGPDGCRDPGRGARTRSMPTGRPRSRACARRCGPGSRRRRSTAE